ncbi:MAG: hypothetical protein CSA34_07730 [Desulfobulbus propionicus]|nr:MAG: hypothetical protein CSA34_07730 [Desulfobulbus propionicus]
MQASQTTSTLSALQFDNQFVRELPGDQDSTRQRRQVYGACYSPVAPINVRQPQLAAWSAEVAQLLGLSPAACRSPQFTRVFAGNELLPGMEPHAMCYGGHQFGNWAGQLGDGRAINLGEVQTAHGHMTLQLKGAGPTPYSRSADGLAVLRSSIREFLCSEAMHHLGVPTTRALSLVTTGEEVVRDMLYNGNPRAEPGCIVCRVAPSFLRFGSYELPASRGETALLRALADFTIRTGFPGLGEPSPVVYADWLREVSRRTAKLLVEWMRIGFVHGVMNTDNMSILGLTIDYGPYGWIEEYDPRWTPNLTDLPGRRYCYGNQPYIAQWNLLQLANALYPLIGDMDAVKDGVETFGRVYQEQWLAMMLEKLGLLRRHRDEDEELVTRLLALLEALHADMTIFFRLLAELPVGSGKGAASLHGPWADRELGPARFFTRSFYDQPERPTSAQIRDFNGWLAAYTARVSDEGQDDEERRARMNRVNPKYILRNYMAHLAIEEAEQGDFFRINELLELLRHPYDEQPEKAEYAAKRPEWARHRPGCSMLSCSS